MINAEKDDNKKRADDMKRMEDVKKQLAPEEKRITRVKEWIKGRYEQ